MNLKGIGLLVLFIFSAVILACNDDGCSEVPAYFSVKSIRNFVLNKRTQQPITTSNPTVWNDVSYLIDLEIAGVAQFEPSPNGALLAFDCAPVGYLGSKIGILALEVISNSNYASLIPAGDSAATIVGVEVLGELLSIQEFNLIFRENYNFTNFKVVLLQAPEIGGALQSFVIRLKLVDGTILETTTDQIRILK